MTIKEKIILGVVAVVVIAGAALASSGVISLSGSNQTTEFFKKMAAAKVGVTSSHIEASVNASVTSPEGDGTFTAKVAGSVVQGEDPSGDLHISLSGSEAGGQSIDVEGDVRVLSHVVYLRATRLPPIPFIEASQIMNRWFVIDPVAMYREFGNEDKAQEYESAFLAGSKMPQEFYEKSYELAYKEGVITKVVSKGSEMISGVAAEKFIIGVNTKKVPDFLTKYVALYNTYAAQVGLKELPEETFSEEERQILSGVAVEDVSLWVGKADYLPYKIAFTMQITDTRPASPDAGMTQGTVAVEILMSDYNKPVVVEKPASSVRIEDFLQSLFGDVMAGSLVE